MVVGLFFNIDMKKERYIYIVIILFGFLLLLDTCETKRILEQGYSLQQNEIQSFKRKKLADSSAIFSQDLTIITLEREAASYKKALELAKEAGIKNPQVVFRTEYKYRSTGKMEADTPKVIEGKPFLKLPYFKSRTDRWRALSIAIDTAGVLTDTTYTFGSFTWAIGDTLRKGFLNKLFNKRDPVVSIKVDNPYIEVTGMQNYVIQEKKRWYQTTAAKIGFGVLIGVAGARALAK